MVVGHVDVGMDVGHGVLEVGAIDGGLPQLGTALNDGLTLLPCHPAHMATQRSGPSSQSTNQSIINQSASE